MARAASSISVTGFVHVDTDGLKKLARDLRETQTTIYAELRKETRAAGAIVAEEAKRRSSWSKRIPGSVRVSVTAFGTAVKVVAGGPKAPDAAPYENKGFNGTFRHPVFGNRDNWVAQQARPFLAPALNAKASEFTSAMADAIDNAFFR